ncbi:MAG TPA: heavy metal-binding domain-containing protein [Thermoanaerobaculia bacterium]|nr:heavy metal-binding domain-containing protein [Thermoanaerobaculia bacterium]
MITRPSSAATLVLAAPLLLAACATQVMLPPLPECHPANPAAPTTPVAAPSAVLERTTPVPAAEPALPEAHGGHSGHGEGGAQAAEGMPGGGMAGAHAGHGDEAAAAYACPMHPEVRSEAPGTCPRCGMALEPAAPADGAPDEGAEQADEPAHEGHR